MTLSVVKRQRRFLRKVCVHHFAFDTRRLKFSNAQELRNSLCKYSKISNGSVGVVVKYNIYENQLLTNNVTMFMN